MREELEKYLDKVTASIPDKKEAEMVRLELEDHIMTKVELLCLSGVDEKDAIRQVLVSMGDEEELQEDLGVVHSNHKMTGKIIYDGEKGHCKYVAKRIGKALGIPYANISDNPKVEDKELLIIIKKSVYGGGATPALMKYLQSLKKGRVKIVVMISTCFYSGGKPIYRINQYATPGYRGKEEGIIRKILMNRGIEVIEERHCYRSYKRLGRIPEQEILTNIKYLAIMMGIYV